MTFKPSILIFDSGAGGLSVAREIQHLNTDGELIYVADNARFPYGIMKDSELITRVMAVMEKVIALHCPDIVVVACNTASTLALEHLRARFNPLFVGVVPAIKPAAEHSRSGVIGLLATPATVDRQYTQKLLENFAQNQHVFRLGSNLLVRYAEDLLNGLDIPIQPLENEIERLIQADSSGTMDTIVLACTHFPLLLNHFQQLKCSQHIHWIDSGQAIARRVKHLTATLTPHTEHASMQRTHRNRRLRFYYTLANTSRKTQQCYEKHLNPDQNLHAAHQLLDV